MDARAESVAETVAFRDALRRLRCLVLTDSAGRRGSRITCGSPNNSRDRRTIEGRELL